MAGLCATRLEARIGPLRRSAVLTLVWAAWHLPLFLVPGWTTAPLWIFALILLGLSFIMSFAVNPARFSVITAIAMHAVFNTISRFLQGLFADVQPGVPIRFELLLALCGLATALVLIVTTKGRLAYAETRQS